MLKYAQLKLNDNSSHFSYKAQNFIENIAYILHKSFNLIRMRRKIFATSTYYAKTVNLLFLWLLINLN